MSDKTKTSREFLERAINSLPSSHEFGTVKRHIQLALGEMNHISSKKVKKIESQSETIESKWKFDLAKGLVNPMSPENTLKTIDQMIRELARPFEKQDEIDVKNYGDVDENMGTLLD